MPIGLVTSAQLEGTKLSFQQSGYLSDFTTVVTVDDVKAPKPAAEPYLLACQRLGVAPEHVLVFEDSNVGLASAINAGCKTVAIPDLVVIDEVIKNQCYAVLNTFEQAYDLL
jgi:beta-phosphoglucomutase-like phosphatase (HAD superfamily)